MVIDCHVHVCAASPGHGTMSQSLLDSLPFRFMRWRLGLGTFGPETERDLESLLRSYNGVHMRGAPRPGVTLVEQKQPLTR